MEAPEADFHNFSTSSSHRLPTISGAEALQNALKKGRGISTGLDGLDAALTTSGVRRGHATEVYGPPGVGKTAFALEVAASVLQSNAEDRVAWIDCAFPLFGPRLHRFMARSGHESATPNPDSHAADVDLLRRFSYIDIRSLPRLLTLLMHPPAGFPASNTSLLVIDDLPTLLLSAFPRTKSKPTGPSTILNRSANKANTRRFQTIESIATAVSKLAAVHNIAIVILSNVTTSLKGGQRAALKPAISAQAWDAVVRTRIFLYRDFCPRDVEEELNSEEKSGVRFAEVIKLDGREVNNSTAVPFVIQDRGIREIRLVKKYIDDQKPELLSPGSMTQPSKQPSPLSQEAFSDVSKDPELPSDPLPQSQLVKKTVTPSQDVLSDVSKRLELPSDPALLSQTVIRQGKRKAVEIADSDEEEEILPIQTEDPTLPEIVQRPVDDDSEDEMLLQ